jgi:hypothetical protein
MPSAEAAKELPCDPSNIRRAMRCVAECFVKVEICWYACAPKV